jgi:pimeloyl-ACP methyl ester carboxylesterase
MQSTFVLVHGAWHGGWCYSRVAERLRAAGHRVFTPTLTGVGERVHLYSRSIDLTTHVTDILNVFKWERLQNVVLVGHSYGGMVVTAVADLIPEKVSSLVYLDAFLPADNQSIMDLQPPERAQAMRASATEANDFAVPPASAAFFNVNEADREWVDSLCTPHPFAALDQRLKLTGGIDRINRKAYVLATGRVGSFNRFRDSVANNPQWTTHELPCGHDVMIDLPDETTAILTGLRPGSP